MGQIQSIEELVSLLLRRRWMIILITLAGLLAAVIFAKSRPDIYETAAVIQIEGAQVAEPTAQDGQQQANGGGAAQILQTIEQRLTTRDALTAVIERHNLFADQPQLAADEKLVALRSAVTFQAVDSAGGQGSAKPPASLRSSSGCATAIPTLRRNWPMISPKGFSIKTLLGNATVPTRMLPSSRKRVADQWPNHVARRRGRRLQKHPCRRDAYAF